MRTPSRHTGDRSYVALVLSATVMVPAHRFGSWIERAPSHRIVWGKLTKAQTRPSRPCRHAYLGPISALGGRQIASSSLSPRRTATGGNGLSCTVSTERPYSWIWREPQHRMVPGQPPNAQKSPYRPTSREKSFPRGARQLATRLLDSALK